MTAGDAERGDPGLWCWGGHRRERAAGLPRAGAGDRKAPLLAPIGNSRTAETRSTLGGSSPRSPSGSAGGTRSCGVLAELGVQMGHADIEPATHVERPREQCERWGDDQRHDHTSRAQRPIAISRPAVAHTPAEQRLQACANRVKPTSPALGGNGSGNAADPLPFASSSAIGPSGRTSRVQPATGELSLAVARSAAIGV